MKKLLLILLCLPMIGFGQEINFKSEKSVRKYFENNATELEGVWNYKLYRLAFIKEENTYKAIVIENTGRYKKGDLKATFEVDSSSSNIVINFKGNKKQDIICNGKIISNQLIEFEILGEKGGDRTFLKEYPLFDFELYDENFNISYDLNLKTTENQPNQLISLQNEINDINLKMELHHQQYFKGVGFSILGLGLTTIGLFSGVDGVTYLGGGFSLVGGIISIRSHRWFKKKPNGINKKRNY